LSGAADAEAMVGSAASARGSACSTSTDLSRPDRGLLELVSAISLATELGTGRGTGRDTGRDTERDTERDTGHADRLLGLVLRGVSTGGGE
jgi:hypothetical protein